MRMILAFLLMLPTVALANPHAEGDLTSVQVHTPTYDASGLLVRSEMVRYDGEGSYQGTVTTDYSRDRLRRISRSVTVSTGADDRVYYRSETEWDYSVKGADRKAVRTVTGLEGRPLRTEHETWRKDPDKPITTVETRVMGPQDALLELRYQVSEFNGKGRLVSRDVSAYDAENRQTFRHLEQWHYDGHKVSVVERWKFDQADELIEHRVEDWTYNDKGRVTKIDTTIFNGREELQGFRHEERHLSPRTGRQQARTLSWTDADDLPIKEMHEELIYDENGRIKTRRVKWEMF